MSSTVIFNIADLCWSEFKRVKNIYTDNDQLDETFRFKCVECSLIENSLLYDSRMDETTCIVCGLIQPFNHVGFTGINEYLPDTSVKIKKSVYKQKDYLKRKLAEISCARISIDDKLLDDVKTELGSDIPKFSSIKRILHMLGHKQKYLQIPTILNILNPIEYPPLSINCKQKRAIKKMFSAYTQTFYILKNVNRKNLLNYHYVLMQIFTILNIKVEKHYFNIPKGKKTIIIHDMIWKQICKHNNWL